MMEQFIFDKTQPALALDALSSSHPISVVINDPDEIESLFDTISYNKGVAIINMLANFLQVDTLQNGLNDYLNTYKYSNAETKDLWKILSMHTNQSLDVKTIMDTWTHQMGFPLITINRENNVITATQERFLLTTEGQNSSLRSLPISKYDYKWYVPFTYFSNIESYITVNVWLNMTDVRFEVEPNVSWIKANVNQTGFYRVMYDEEIWTKLILELRKNHKIFNAADRANLLDDAFTLSRAGLLNGTVPLELSLYLVNERDYVPWATALEHFQAWSRRLSESLAYKLFLKYMRKILTPIAQYIGWSDKGTHLERLLRTHILSAGILCELNSTITQAKYSFQQWMVKNESIQPDLREVVYSAGIKYGGTLEWQFCWNNYISTSTPNEKKLLLQALGLATDPWLLQRYLLESLNNTKIKSQDVKIVLSVVAANPEGRLLAWRHLKAYWPSMQKVFENSSYTMGNLISAVTAHLSTPYDYYEVSTYFNGMDVGGAKRVLEQSLETIKLNINWVSQNAEDIYTWLIEHVK